MRLIRLSLCLCCLLLSLVVVRPFDAAVTAEEVLAEGEKAEKLPVDSYGSPLPPPAIARLGTLRLRDPSAQVRCVAFSPSGDFIASGGGEGILYCWDSRTGQELFHTRQEDDAFKSILSLACFPDGKRIAYSNEGGKIYVVDREKKDYWAVAETGRLKGLGPQSLPVAVSRDGRFLAAGIERTKVAVWDTASKKQLHTLKDFSHTLRALAFSPDGKYLAAAGGGWRDDSTVETPIRIWKVSSGEVAGELKGHLAGVHSLAYSPDGTRLISGGVDLTIRVWDVEKTKEVLKIDTPYPKAVVYSPRAKVIAAATATLESGYKLQLWNFDDGKLLRTIPLSEPADALAFSPDGKRLVSGGQGTALRVWDVETGKDALPFDAHTSFVLGLAFSPDGKRLASRGIDETVRVWDLDKRRPLFVFPLAETGPATAPINPRFEPINSGLAFSSNGTILAAISRRDAKIRRWDLTAGKLKDEWDDGPVIPYDLAISPDGRVLAIATPKGTRLWSLADRKEVALLGGGLTADKRRRRDLSLAFSPAGRLLVIGDSAESLRFTEYPSCRPLREVKMASFGVNYITFSSDGLFLAAGGEWLNPKHEKAVILREAATGERMTSIGNEDGPFHGATISPDGRLVAAKRDRRIYVWNLYTGKEVARFEGHAATVLCVAFSPDGKVLASGSADSTILLWDVSKLDRKVPATAPTAKEFDRLWSDLSGRDSAAAFKAIAALIGAGDKATALLDGQLKATPAPDVKRVPKLLADLDAEDFAVRDAAFQELSKLGEVIEPAVRKALAGKPSAEAKAKLESLLAGIEATPLDADGLRRQRALLVLEQVGSKAARACLERLAKGAPSRLTRDAQAALKRLGAAKP